MNRARRRPLPSGVYTTQLLPPRKPVLTVSDDHITDPVNIRPRTPTFAAETREDTLNDVVYRLGILCHAVANGPIDTEAAVVGVTLAREYVKAMRDAEQ